LKDIMCTRENVIDNHNKQHTKCMHLPSFLDNPYKNKNKNHWWRKNEL